MFGAPRENHKSGKTANDASWCLGVRSDVWILSEDEETTLLHDEYRLFPGPSSLDPSDQTNSPSWLVEVVESCG